MVIDATMVNWDSIQSAMEVLKPEEFAKSNFNKIVKIRLQRMKTLLKDNWDPQEINVDNDGDFFGVPIELASIVLYVVKYATDHDINLTDAMEKVAASVGID